MSDHKFHLKKIRVSKLREGFDHPVPSDSHLPPFPPNFRANENQIPEMKGWPQGGHYIMVMEIRMSEKSGDEGKPVNGSFDIVAYKYLPKKTIDEMTDEEFGSHQGEALDAASKGKQYV